MTSPHLLTRPSERIADRIAVLSENGSGRTISSNPEDGRRREDLCNTSEGEENWISVLETDEKHRRMSPVNAMSSRSTGARVTRARTGAAATPTRVNTAETGQANQDILGPVMASSSSSATQPRLSMQRNLVYGRLTEGARTEGSEESNAAAALLDQVEVLTTNLLNVATLLRSFPIEAYPRVGDYCLRVDDSQ